MASHTAIAAVSRTLRTLLLDRMVTGAAVTLAPPDVEVTGVDGARVNLYLMQVIENAALKNQEIPGQGHPAAYGHPPLSLDLRYLVTTHSAMENQEEADLNAQTILGDAMRVMNDFGNRIDQLAIVNPVAGTPGDPILDPDLTREFERLKIVLHPASLDDITKVWSAVSGTNFRRSVVYEVTVVQIETPAPRRAPQPVETRRIFMTVRKRPEIVDAYVSPALLPAIPSAKRGCGIGEEITIVSQGALADQLYVRLGSLEPIRVSPPGDGRVRIVVAGRSVSGRSRSSVATADTAGRAVAGRAAGSSAHRRASGRGRRRRAWTGNGDRRLAALRVEHLASAARPRVMPPAILGRATPRRSCTSIGNRLWHAGARARST